MDNRIIQEMIAALEIAEEALDSCHEGDTSTGHVIDPWFDEELVKTAYEKVRQALFNAKSIR